MVPPYDHIYADNAAYNHAEHDAIEKEETAPIWMQHSSHLKSLVEKEIDDARVYRNRLVDRRGVTTPQ